MKNISDIIEDYLLSVLNMTDHTGIEIKRKDIANKFSCVPSQINYVINTRFTLEKGYLVESKRGGGGYIRIVKIHLNEDTHILNEILRIIGSELTNLQAEQIIIRLEELQIITKREAKLMLLATETEQIIKDIHISNQTRAKVVKNMLTSLKYI